MSDPTPLREKNALLERAAQVEPWREADRQETWRRLAAGPEPRRGRLAWLTAASAVAAIIVAVDLGSPNPLPQGGRGQGEGANPLPQRGRGQGEGAVHLVDLGSLGTLEAGTAAVYHMAGPRTLLLSSGRVCATIRHRDPSMGPFVVLAPSLRVVDLGTRFCVETAAGRTAVEVTEGKVRVEAEGGRSVSVAAGQRVDSADARLVPASAAAPVPAVAPQEATPPSCDRLGALEARERCFAAASTGDDLAAQNALYSLALLARDQRRDGAAALTLFQTYLHRFPAGPLAPEASLGILTELEAESRYAAAAAEAQRYLTAHPGENKAPEVRLILANLERERLGRPEAARDAYAQVLQGQADREVQGEALFGLALSELQLGQRADAEGALRRYLAEHPAGARAADAQRLLRR